MEIKASAPGNIFFFGEHAVVYNRPSINASIDRRTYITLKERNDSKVIVYSDAFGKCWADIDNGLADIHIDTKELAPVMEFLDKTMNTLEIKQGFNLKIRSDIPVAGGMSSSTALFCSMLKALGSHAHADKARGEYFDCVYPFQVKVHGGKASGSEIISSSLGGFNRILKPETGKITWKHLGEHKFSVVVGDSKVSAPTALTVGYHVPSLIKRRPELVWETFDKIAGLVKKAEAAIENDNIESIGSLMNENQKLLFSLGLSHPKLDDCIHEALNAGALGAKLSGAGWGGIMFALCNPEDQDKIAEAIGSTGANVIKTEIGVDGVRSE